MTPTRCVELLGEAGAHVGSAVGVKAVNLGRMLDAGLSVPDGFCVAAQAYREHVRGLGLSEALSSEALDLAAIRAAIIDGAVAEALAAEIRKAFESLGSAVAVRSSGTVEDLPGHSFAGQYETFLNVATADECVTAVKRCWASLWTDRAFAYRRANGIDHASAEMAVIIQRMVAAEVSGIAFTADPVTGNRGRIVIEAAPGSGEGVVQGKVVPDRILIDKKTGDILHQTLGVDRSDCCMKAESIRQLSSLSARVEELFGCPQDIEWSMASGTIWLLQARPITALPDAKRVDWDDHQIWSNVNAGEVMPDVATPMTSSVLDGALCDLFGQFFGMLGLEMDPMSLAGRVAGRYYFNVNAVVAMLLCLPGKKDTLDLSKIFGGNIEDVERFDISNIDPAYLPPARIRWIRGVWGLARFLVSLRPGVEPRARRKLEFVRRKFDAVRESYRAGMSEDQLCSLYLGTIRDALNIGDMSPLMAVTMVYSSVMFHLCGKWLGDQKLALANQLMAGVGGLEDAQAAFDLWDLAKRAAGNPQVMEAVRSGCSFADLRCRLEAGDEGRPFLAAWEEFMARHGHLCRGEIELANPRWAEQPDFVLGMLRSYLLDLEATNPHKRKEAAARRREELFAECRKRLNPLKRWIFSWVVRKAQLGSRIRENIKNSFILAVAVMRRVLLELGERLTARGVLGIREDIFFVFKKELQPVVEGTIEPCEIRRRIAERRREYEYHQSLNPPPIVVGPYDPARHSHPQPDPLVQHLNGLAVSAGVVSGPARVILHASDDFVRPGEILVAPFTDPGWTPYFVNAAGIVMDQGGLLSHGSIVAREFGVPCVVNVGLATKMIQTGQVIRVDGDVGVVWLAEPGFTA